MIDGKVHSNQKKSTDYYERNDLNLEKFVYYNSFKNNKLVKSS
jgi:hypothetical protein